MQVHRASAEVSISRMLPVIGLVETHRCAGWIQLTVVKTKTGGRGEDFTVAVANRLGPQCIRRSHDVVLAVHS